MKRFRAWRQILFTGTVALASLAVAVPASADGIEIPKSASPYFQDPAFKQAFDAEQQRLKDLWEQRTSPEGQQALEDSASAYADLSASEAIDVATDVHAETLAEPSFDPLAGVSSSDIEDFAGDYGAVIDVPDEESDALIESTLPLQAESPSGDLEAVDNQLEDDGAVLEPENSLAELALPAEVSEDAQDAIELPDVNVAVTPEDVSASPDADVVAQRAFYANAYTDTDFIAGPVAGGFESFYQLRSAESPESFSLAFDLPDGAELTEQGPGAAITRGGETLAEIAPPSAWDADGFRVPVSYRVEGDELVVEVPHHDDDWAYPILVDPTITESYLYWDNGTTNVNFNEWTYAENDIDYVSSQGDPAQGLYSRGLYVVGGSPWSGPTWAPGGDYYFGYLSLGSWSFSAPGTQSRIYKATFAHVQAASPLVDPYGQPFHWVMQGITKANGSWEDGITSAYGASSPLVQGGNFPSEDIEHCLDAAAPYCRDFAGSNNNYAQLMSFANPGGYPPSGFWTFMGGASVSIADTILPTMGTLTHTYTDATGVHSGLPSGWVDSVNLTFRSQARDLGLGVKSFNLNVPGLPLQTRTVTCAGDRSDRCPNTAMYASHTTQQQNADDYTTGHSFDYSTAEVPGTAPEMPEGIVKPTGWATDALGNLATKAEWQLKVDRSAPTVALSGPLKDAANSGGTLIKESYGLTITTTEGSNAANSQRRSGVKNVQVFVDGALEFSTPNRTCPLDSCGYTDSWTFESGEYEFGQHTVSVVAKDQLNHATDPNANSLTFTTGLDSNDAEPPLIAIEPQSSPPGQPYQLNVTATDQGGTGVVHMEVYVDGQFIQAFDQECPNGGCSMPRTLQMSGSQRPENHEIIVFATDRGGNGEVNSAGAKTARYELHGYQDAFADNPPGLLDAAVNGNANVIRFPIDWCSIESTENNYNWSDYEGIFQAIRSKNAGITDVNNAVIKVIALPSDSPGWANGTNDPCGPKPVTPPNPSHEAHWNEFISAFLNKYGSPENGVIAVEAWNEPNLAHFWGKTDPTTFVSEPGRFAHLVNGAYQAVTAYEESYNSPPPPAPPPPTPRDILVVPGGLSPRGQDVNLPRRNGSNVKAYMEAAFTPDPNNPDKIVAAAINAVSVHLYASTVKDDDKALKAIRDQLAEVRAGLPTAYSQVPQWITEIGFPSNPKKHLAAPNSSKPRQCYRLKRAYFAFGNDNLIQAFIVYRLRDPASDEPQNFGVTSPTGTQRRAYKWLTKRYGQLPGGPECRQPAEDE